MMQIKIEAKNIDKIQKELWKLQKRTKDLSSVMTDIAEHLYTITDESFDNETAPDGTPWEDLKPATWRYKKTDKILYEEGTLRGSLYIWSSDSEARIGVNATSKGYPYPIVHQFGSKHVPARPFLPIDSEGNMYKEVVNEILNMLVEYLKN